MKDNVIINQVKNETIKICNPFKIYLVSHKTNSKGDLTSFKLCIIVDDRYEGYKKLESDILIKTDCPVPFDVIVYTVSEWNSCVEDDCTFAYRVENSGEVLYEQE